MQPTCLTCGRPVEEGRTCCHTCLAGVDPHDSTRCSDCGDPIRPEQTLCDFCMYKHLHSQSYPPSIVPAAVDATKAAIMDSMMLTLTNIVEQADALIVQLARLKGAIK